MLLSETTMSQSHTEFSFIGSEMVVRSYKITCQLIQVMKQWPSLCLSGNFRRTGLPAENLSFLLAVRIGTAVHWTHVTPKMNKPLTNQFCLITFWLFVQTLLNGTRRNTTGSILFSCEEVSHPFQSNIFVHNDECSRSSAQWYVSNRIG